MKTQHTRVSAYALITKDDKMLLCRFSDELPCWSGKWTLPGGGVQFGEDPEATVIREVKEETGLIVKVASISKIASIVGFKGDKEIHGVCLIYHVDVTGGELRNEKKGTTDLVSWLSENEIQNIPLVELAEVGVEVVFPMKLQALTRI